MGRLTLMRGDVILDCDADCEWHHEVPNLAEANTLAREHERENPGHEVMACQTVRHHRED